MYRPHFLANLRAFYAQTFFGHCYVRSPVYVYLCVVYLSLQVLDFPFHLILVFQTARFNCVQRQIYAFVFNVPFIFLIALNYANSEDNCAYQYNFEGYEGLRIFAFEWYVPLNYLRMAQPCIHAGGGGGTSIWNCSLTFHPTNYTKISVICRRTQLVLGLSAWLIPPPKIFYSKIMRHKSVLYDKIIRCKRLPAIMLCIMTSADTSRASQLVICSNEKFSNWNSKTIALYCDEEER